MQLHGCGPHHAVHQYKEVQLTAAVLEKAACANVPHQRLSHAWSLRVLRRLAQVLEPAVAGLICHAWVGPTNHGAAVVRSRGRCALSALR
jgi:hypothetical protein